MVGKVGLEPTPPKGPTSETGAAAITPLAQDGRRGGSRTPEAPKGTGFTDQRDLTDSLPPSDGKWWSHRAFNRICRFSIGRS